MRWFTGGSYQQVGFLREAVIPPDYFYHMGGIRFNKSTFRKSGIARHHPEVYDPALTEREMMEMAGYQRIWDCGKVRWTWTASV